MCWFNDRKRNGLHPKLFARPSVEAIQVSLLARVFRTSDKDAPMRNDGAAVTRTWECRFPSDVIRRSPMERRFVLLSDTIPERPAELRPIPCPHCQGQQQGKRNSSPTKYSAIHVQGEAPESDDSSRDCEVKWSKAQFQCRSRRSFSAHASLLVGYRSLRICALLAPRLRQKILAANVTEFTPWTTKRVHLSLLAGAKYYSFDAIPGLRTTLHSALPPGLARAARAHRKRTVLCLAFLRSYSSLVWCIKSSVCSQRLHHGFQLTQFAPQLQVFRFQFLIQSLDRRQRHAIRIHRTDRFVVGAQAESRLEILRHGAEVTCGRVQLVSPRQDRQGRHLLEHCAAVHWGEVTFHIAIARRIDCPGHANVSDDDEGLLWIIGANANLAVHDPHDLHITEGVAASSSVDEKAQPAGESAIVGGLDIAGPPLEDIASWIADKLDASEAGSAGRLDAAGRGIVCRIKMQMRRRVV